MVHQTTHTSYISISDANLFTQTLTLHIYITTIYIYASSSFVVATSKSEQLHELPNLLREPALLVAVVVVVALAVVLVVVLVIMIVIGILPLHRRRKPRLGGGVKPNPARMDPTGGSGVADQDCVVAVGDLAAVAATAVAGAERQRQRTAGLEVAVDRTEAEERQRNGIDGADGKRNGFRFGMMGSRFGVRFGFGEGVRNIAGA